MLQQTKESSQKNTMKKQNNSLGSPNFEKIWTESQGSQPTKVYKGFEGKFAQVSAIGMCLDLLGH